MNELPINNSWEFKLIRTGLREIFHQCKKKGRHNVDSEVNNFKQSDQENRIEQTLDFERSYQEVSLFIGLL